MKITEVITEAEKSWWDSTKEFGSEVGKEVAHAPKAMYDLGKKAATATGDIIDKRDQIAAQMGRGWEAAKKDPSKALSTAGEIAQAGARGALNTATFGYGDKALAAVKTAGSAFDKPLSGSDDWTKRYEQEKERQYAKSAELRDKYPVASTVGDVGGLLVNPAFMGGAKLARYAAGKAMPGVVQKAFAPAAGQTAKNIGKKAVALPAKVATDLTGGLAATKAVEKGVKKYDPTDPYYGAEDYRVFEERLKYLINYR
jgi:hypothetical protein